MALFTSDLSRDGPGLLLRDIRKGDDPQITATIDILVEVSPDIVVLAGFDYDYGGAALGAFSDALNDAGLDLGHRYATQPNSGLMTDLDLDGNDRFGEPRDAQGYGTFSGDNGMAILSRWAVASAQAKDFSDLLWRDIPDANLPIVDGALFPNSMVYEVQRLSSTAHWDVPVALPNGQVLHLLTHYATPPVFDGPEDRNGRRNADELGFWSHYLTGVMGPAPTAHYVLVAAANLDPFDGDGRGDAMQAFLASGLVQDPEPSSAGAAYAADPNHNGDPALDTVDWDADGPGNLRVDYVLPSPDWTISGAGVFWPAPEDDKVALLGGEGRAASRHRLVWVDLVLD